MAQARKYVADTMGDKYADGVILDLEKMWYESTARSPMVCLLSLGSDPTNNIESLAKKHKLGNFLSLYMVSYFSDKLQIMHKTILLVNLMESLLQELSMNKQRLYYFCCIQCIVFKDKWKLPTKFSNYCQSVIGYV